MVTRIYLPGTGPAPINPAFGTWTETTGADRIAGVATRIGSAMASKSQAHSATAANSTYLSRQYVFGPLAAQTIPVSTIKGTIRVSESGPNDNLNAMRLLVRVVSGDGSTYRTPVLYGPANGTVAEFSTSLRAKRLATDSATASVVVSAGDYLVIEIGTTTTVGGTSPSDSISYGDDSATDLGDNETDTAANNPFVEIAATITLLAVSGSDAGAGSDTAGAPAVALAGVESGAGVEAAALTSITSIGADGGVGTDAATVNTGGVAKSAADSAIGAEGPAVLAATTDVRPEVGAGSDASAGIRLETRTETGDASDAQAQLTAVLPIGDDAGAGLDAATLATLIVAADAALGSDATIIAALYAAAETGVGAELAVLTAGFVATDLGAGDEQTALAAFIAALEAGSGVDLAAVLGASIGGSVGAQARILGALGAMATLATSLAVGATARDGVGAEHG
jgi:hypothetical protein